MTTTAENGNAGAKLFILKKEVKLQQCSFHWAHQTLLASFVVFWLSYELELNFFLLLLIEKLSLCVVCHWASILVSGVTCSSLFFFPGFTTRIHVQKAQCFSSACYKTSHCFATYLSKRGCC